MTFRENEGPISSTILGPVDMDVSAEDEEATLTMIEDIHADAVLETEGDPAVFSVETQTVSSTEPEASSAVKKKPFFFNARTLMMREIMCSRDAQCNTAE